MSTWVSTTTVTRLPGGRPSKYQIMRRNRRDAERRRCREEFEELREEARAFGFDDTGDVLAALGANDETPPAVRRWWWNPLQRVAAALSAAPVHMER